MPDPSQPPYCSDLYEPVKNSSPISLSNLNSVGSRNTSNKLDLSKTNSSTVKTPK